MIVGNVGASGKLFIERKSFETFLLGDGVIPIGLSNGEMGDKSDDTS